MSFSQSFFSLIIELILGILELYKWIIIVAALISWVNPDPYNPIVKFLYAVTEPALRPIRRIIGYRLGPIDVSPLVLIVAILIVQAFFRSMLRSF